MTTPNPPDTYIQVDSAWAAQLPEAIVEVLADLVVGLAGAWAKRMADEGTESDIDLISK